MEYKIQMVSNEGKGIKENRIGIEEKEKGS